MAPRESSRIDDETATADANPRASTRIDEQAFVDRVSLDLIGAHAKWIGTRGDRVGLRRALILMLSDLER